MEKDYSPLSLACVKSLSDKSYDKRRQAAAEIEKFVYVMFIVSMIFFAEVLKSVG